MPVRVKVCLNKIFKDHRQEAFVNVDSNLLRVSNLEEHIRQLFNIKPRIYLTIDGVLLPSLESVHVIHSGDVIKYLFSIISQFIKNKHSPYFSE